DALAWIALVPATRALAVALRVPARWRTPVALFPACVPPFRLLVGSGYAEPLLNLCIVLCALFAVRALRGGDRAAPSLRCLAGALACGTKLLALPAILPPCLGALAACLLAGSGPAGRRARARDAVLAAAIFACFEGPWLLRNVQLSGYPLSPAD